MVAIHARTIMFRSTITVQGVPKHNTIKAEVEGISGLKRSLKADTEVTVVETAQALRDAVVEGKPHTTSPRCRW